MAKQKTILVTGAAGFIGSAVGKRLHEMGYSLVLVDNFNDYYSPQLKEDRVEHFLSDTNAPLYRINIADYDALENALKDHQIDIVCHLAAQAGVRYGLENPFAYEESNLKGTLSILEIARRKNIKDIIMASSSSVYGDDTKPPFKEESTADKPISLYAATKRSAEMMAYSYHHNFDLNITNLRYFTVYGPWTRPDMAIYKFANAISKGDPIDVYGNGKMERDFTYIDDIVEGTIKAIEKTFSWEIINLGFGSPSPLMEYIELLEEYFGKKIKKNFMPMQLGDVKITYADISKAKQLLNWEPRISTKEGVKKFVDWHEEYHKDR